MSDDLRPRFGDAEPEDSWDPDDPLPDLIHNLERRILVLRGISLRDRLDLVDRERDEIGRSRSLTDRDRLRLSQLDEDIEFLRGRLDEEGE